MSEAQPNPSDSKPLEPSDSDSPAQSPQLSDAIAPTEPSDSPAAAPSPRPASRSQTTNRRSSSTKVITVLQEIWQKLRPLINRLWNAVRPLLVQLGNFWNHFVAQLHQRLPETWRSRLPQPVFSLVLAANLVFFVWVTSGLLSNSSANKPTQPPRQVASTPASPVAAPSADRLAADTIDAIAPDANNTEISANLAPEQRLIAAVQQQITEVAQQSADGLIQSIQANFRNHRLTVKLSQDWYTLDEMRQDELTNQMLQRAQALEFSKLEVVDETETRLARSPVVGSDMIVLVRRL